MYKENSKSDKDVSVLNEYVEKTKIDAIFEDPEAQVEKIDKIRNKISENQKKLKQLIHIQAQYQELSNQMGETYVKQNNTMKEMLDKET